MKFKLMEDYNPERFMEDISEESSHEDVIAFIKANCKFILAEIRKTPASLKDYNFLYRGIKKSFNKDDSFIGDRNYFIGTVRKDRRPKDLSIDLHVLFDNAFEEVFGWKARSQGLFTSGHKSDTSSYGRPYVVFPIGQFNFIYSKEITDLYTDLDNSLRNYNIITKYNLKIKNKKKLIKMWDSYDEDYQHRAQLRIQMLKQYPEIVKALVAQEYTDKNLSEGLKAHNEIMINCDKYVAVYYDIFKYYDFADKLMEPSGERK